MNIPHKRPVHPGQLVIQNGTAHHEAVRLRDEYHENVRLFPETLQVEKVLIKQIVAAVDSEYLKELRNETTNTIAMSVPEVLEHLFTHYGQVDSDVLDKGEQRLRNFVWNLNDPRTKIFKKVEDLVSLAQAANLEKSPQQTIGFGLDLIRRTGDMEHNIREWHNRPAAEKTWLNFKTHFSAAYHDLKRIRGPTMRNTAFHQAHQVVTDLSRDCTQMRDEVMAVMNSVTMMQDGAATNDVTDSNPPAIDTPAPSMNATIDKDILLAIKKLLKEELKSNKGDRHLRQEKQGLRSTKNIQSSSSEPTAVKTNDVICSLVSSTDKAFMDLTGRFPIKSTRGN